MADVYGDLARRYDGMVSRNETRQKFLTGVLQEAGARNVLDCACGTGQDLLWLSQRGFRVYGSDLSEAMLHQARHNLVGAKAKIDLQHTDFRNLH